jgi:hypothetical protein
MMATELPPLLRLLALVLDRLPDRLRLFAGLEKVGAHRVYLAHRAHLDPHPDPDPVLHPDPDPHHHQSRQM